MIAQIRWEYIGIQGIVRYERPPARQRHMGSPQPSHLWTASVSAAKVGVMTYVNAQCRRNHLRVESAWVHRAPDLMFQEIPGLRFGNIGKLKISKSMKISREKIKHCRFLVETSGFPCVWDPHGTHIPDTCGRSGGAGWHSSAHRTWLLSRVSPVFLMSRRALKNFLHNGCFMI